ncbi:hypothetical protein LRP50_24930 [Enterovibrio sp. ZSDZ42]|uniref:Uncharacterized protein n=1 Tax=Enterovibrio gelatinilyticus TaxID=2899819 RepID=A0ABT5R7W9_9GAMM|nr:hypothetical protein [Enterovibrio sp. ZSDZ42]MDD1796369.1 hypothetical protein [Enterovibrio sp. ZSDZ42]
MRFEEDILPPKDKTGIPQHNDWGSRFKKSIVIYDYTKANDRSYRGDPAWSNLDVLFMIIIDKTKKHQLVHRYKHLGLSFFKNKNSASHLLIY